MALAKLPSATIEGVTSLPVEVEVDVASGLPAFIMVGLADKAVEEARERVRSAIKHTGYNFPLSRITVHLAPSERKKSGVHFDLPIALGILLADGQLTKTDRYQGTLFLGGLSLDGGLQSIAGTLSLVEWAKHHNFTRVILPVGNYPEATLIDDIELLPVNHLSQVLEWLSGQELPANNPKITRSKVEDFAADWLQIQGQAQAKRAAVIAAAGGHNLLLEGSPGAGKTLLARGLRSLLPPLTRSELLEVVKLHSLAGQIKPHQAVDSLSRPFRSPHHSASQVAVTGGGTSPRPGEISLAHRGVLFLDELPEFNRLVLEALRQPLEDGEINVSRIRETVRYPADFILVATMNPCPCGWLGSNQKECVCTAYQIANYRKKISGPIIDRIDLFLRVPAVSLKELRAEANDRAELEGLQQKIQAARQLQQRRNHNLLNNSLPSRAVKSLIRLTPPAEQLIEKASQKIVLTGRGYHKMLKVAQTIADLQEEKLVGPAQVAEALRYRFADTR